MWQGDDKTSCVEQETAISDEGIISLTSVNRSANKLAIIIYSHVKGQGFGRGGQVLEEELNSLSLQVELIENNQLVLDRFSKEVEVEQGYSL